eukprot:UN24459
MMPIVRMIQILLRIGDLSCRLSLRIVYIAQKYDQRGGLLLCFAVLALFLGYKTFLSNQKVSGSYKNGYRKLRVYTFIS